VSATVHVVDDDAAVRDSLATLLSLHGYATRTFESGESFLDKIGPSPTGCVLVDLRMPGLSGLELQREMKSRRIDLPAVFVTGHGDVKSAVEAMKRGAVDFIEKPFDERRLLEAIRRALGGPEGERPGALAGERLANLTEREREVLALVAEGYTSREIGDKLGISGRTVDVHRANLLSKTGARNTADLIRLAIAAPRS
jgi:two-component system, LuxR family, response regulator FixJ